MFGLKHGKKLWKMLITISQSLKSDVFKFQAKILTLTLTMTFNTIKDRTIVTVFLKKQLRQLIDHQNSLQFISID